MAFLQQSDFFCFKAVKNINKSINTIDFEKIIRLSGGGKASCLAVCLHANERWAIFDKTEMRCIKKILHSIYRKCYTNIISVPDTIHLMKRTEMLIQELGIKNFKAKMIYIPQTMNMRYPEQRYITISIDSSNKIRQWGTNNFVDLIRLLLEKYRCNIYIIGNNVDEIIIKQLEISFTGYSGRVKNIVGKTNIKEWIEWIRGSTFHVGVDSGSIHVAASVGTPVFCLAGAWDNHRAVSYNKNSASPRTVLPVCIFRSDIDELRCSGCLLRGGKYGYGNKKCFSLCQKGQPCLCLQKISVEDVMIVINNVMKVSNIL